MASIDVDIDNVRSYANKLLEYSKGSFEDEWLSYHYINNLYSKIESAITAWDNNSSAILSYINGLEDIAGDATDISSEIDENKDELPDDTDGTPDNPGTDNPVAPDAPDAPDVPDKGKKNSKKPPTSGRRKVNTEKIKELTIKVLEKLQDIINTKQDLMNNINKIKECYEGKDSETIQAKYLESVNELDKVIKVIKEYLKYFKWLSEKYEDNIDKAIKNLKTVREDKTRKTA